LVPLLRSHKGLKTLFLLIIIGAGICAVAYPIFPSLSFMFALSPSPNSLDIIVPYAVQPVSVFERISLLSFQGFQAGRINLDLLNQTAESTRFLVQIVVSYLGVNITGVYNFTVFGGTYQASVRILVPSLPFVPYEMRIAALQLTNSVGRYGEVYIATIYPYPRCEWC